MDQCLKLTFSHFTAHWPKGVRKGDPIASQVLVLLSPSNHYLRSSLALKTHSAFLRETQGSLNSKDQLSGTQCLPYLPINLFSWASLKLLSLSGRRSLT